MFLHVSLHPLLLDPVTHPFAGVLLPAVFSSRVACTKENHNPYMGTGGTYIGTGGTYMSFLCPLVHIKVPANMAF